MTKNVITIGNATVDAAVFAAYNKKALEELGLEHKLKADAKEAAKDFKETVEAVSLTTKLPKPELAAYFKARFEESLPKEDDDKVVGTKVVIDRGELYTVLNSALDD